MRETRDAILVFAGTVLGLSLLRRSLDRIWPLLAAAIAYDIYKTGGRVMARRACRAIVDCANS